MSRQPVQNYYQVHSLGSGIYRILGGGIPCSDLIVGTHTAALIDTGLGFGNLPQFVRGITQLPLLLFNTHCHVDHTGSNALFHLPVHMGREDIPFCSYANSPEFRKGLLGALSEDSELRPSEEEMDDFLLRGCGETIACDAGESFDLGGFTLEVYNAPGHSLGSRAFYLKEERLLYTGDAAYPCTLVFGYGSASRATHIQTLRSLLHIPYRQYYGAHQLEPFTREDMELCLHVAQEADYAKGIPFPNPLKGGEDARLCYIQGMEPPEELRTQMEKGVCIVDKRAVGIILSSCSK